MLHTVYTVTKVTCRYILCHILNKSCCNISVFVFFDSLGQRMGTGSSEQKVHSGDDFATRELLKWKR